MRDDLETLLSRLPEPAPRSALAAGVMARIAREPARATNADALRVPDRGDRHALAAAVIGFALVAGAIGRGWFSDGFWPGVAVVRSGVDWRFTPIPFDGAGALLVGSGLWLSMMGLFAPLRRGAKRLSSRIGRRPDLSGHPS